jgi:hypothetical protein
VTLDAAGYYALGVPFALAVDAWDHFACRRRGERGWTISTAVSHLSTSMGEVLVGIFLAPFLFWIYDWALAHIALVRWPRGSLSWSRAHTRCSAALSRGNHGTFSAGSGVEGGRCHRDDRVTVRRVRGAQRPPRARGATWVACV